MTKTLALALLLNASLGTPFLKLALIVTGCLLLFDWAFETDRRNFG